MIRINVIVEGQTEETFVQGILSRHMGEKNIFLSARCVEVGRKRNKIYRGGVVNYAKVKNDVMQWLKQDAQAYVTTMIDYYRLPQDFPGYGASQKETEIYETAKAIQDAFYQDIGDQRFIPYIQMHEFEGLLFSCTDTMNGILKPLCGRNPSTELKRISDQFETPEHINNGPDTAPSRRLLRLCPAYDKVLHGSLIGERLGVLKILDKCKHFSGWLDRMSKLTPLAAL